MISDNDNQKKGKRVKRKKDSIMLEREKFLYFSSSPFPSHTKETTEVERGEHTKSAPGKVEVPNETAVIGTTINDGNDDRFALICC